MIQEKKIKVILVYDEHKIQKIVFIFCETVL